MIDWSWIDTTPTTALMIVLSALGIYVALMLFTRAVGLRSFSKMSSFDFAITVAFGTILASTLYSKRPTLVEGLIALAALFGIQYVVAVLRVNVPGVNEATDNTPLLLMAGSEILYDNLKDARITEGDLKGKLRESNVIDYSQVRAVVFEATGDVSVLHADEDGPDLNPDLLDGVRDADKLRDKKNVQKTTTGEK
ncbi:MAG: DUF421 domain-containing protein [Bacteroidetes bacterium QS_8_64_10]|nr:MAG: DUF421 domain-containing protein [Bacteroidetes bacterium QS_8_64_10]